MQLNFSPTEDELNKEERALLHIQQDQSEIHCPILTSSTMQVGAMYLHFDLVLI